MEGHKVILKGLLELIKDESVTAILDAGSGRTSLSIITEAFPDTPVDAIVFPGDLRKIYSIKKVKDSNKNISLIEKDICRETVGGEYDLVVAHLLLGEAVKFGNSFGDMLEKLLTLGFKYLVIIDYMEDPSVNVKDILDLCERKGLTVVEKAYYTNQRPQVWEDFVGTQNFGYLIKRT